MVQLTYYEPPERATGTGPVRRAGRAPARGGELRHGYTLQDLDHLTRIAITRRAFYRDRDADERYACGWHAAVELLLTAVEPPGRGDLIRAAWEAADALTLRTLEDCGIPRFRSENPRTFMPRFCAYWHTVARHTAGPEERVVERVALAQTWERLTPVDQEALRTLAACESYQVAADALGLKYHTFHRRVRMARDRFLRLWLEGETPRRAWRDRRVQTPGGSRQTASSHIRRRARAKAARERGQR